MFIDAKKIATAALGIDAKGFHHPTLSALCFDFDTDSNTLSIVGTDAQLMIITKTKITKSDDIDFCTKHFNHAAFYIPDALLKHKALEIEIKETDGGLLFGDFMMREIDARYPNYKSCIPARELVPLTGYRSFCIKLLQKANKALGLKDPHTITDTPPMVAKDATESCPCLWDKGDIVIILMGRQTVQNKGE